jgi:glycine oxidase
MIVTDVVVCGAGVIGCAVARALALAGLKVHVLERSRPGDEASGAAAGMLTAQAFADASSPYVELGRRSLGMYEPLARELAEETGIEIEFRRSGSLRLPSGGADELELSSLFFFQKKSGWPVELASTERLAEITNGKLSKSFRNGVFFREEGIVDNERLVRALWFSAERHGAKFLLGSPALAIRIEHDVCTGVSTELDKIEAKFVVNAAGAWADFDHSIAFPVPVRPARGQIVELFSEGATAPCVIHRQEFYIVPRSDGRTLIGSTVEFVGFEKKVTAEAVERLLSRAIEVVPTLSEARFSRAWSGLRPATLDSLPILGVTPLPGYLMAAGHFGSGILLAPVTGEILASVILGTDFPIDLQPFRLDRFVGTADLDRTGRFRFTGPI